MATLKHIASKNSDYTAIEAYLVYQHDAFTGKQLLDEQGRPKLRESYILDTLECGDFSFATACLLANRKYGKNTQHSDIKSHQYIISFDPRDAADNGLTMEKAQALGLKFCEENFPGPSRHRLHSPGWAQPFGKHPRPHRDRQHPNTRSGTQALYAEAPRLA